MAFILFDGFMTYIFVQEGGMKRYRQPPNKKNIKEEVYRQTVVLWLVGLGLLDGSYNFFGMEENIRVHGGSRSRPD